MFEQTVTRALSRLGLDQRGADPHPRQPAPMLLQRADKMFASPDWVYEPKWDGFRVLASARDGAVRLISRNGASFTNLFGPITDVLRGFLTSIARLVGWGKVVEHEDGFRAQYARPLPPFLVGTENLHLAVPLARIGIGPVMGVDRDGWTGSGVEAQVMRFLNER